MRTRTDEYEFELAARRARWAQDWGDRASEVAASLEDSLLATTGGFLARIAPAGGPEFATMGRFLGRIPRRRI